MVASARRIIDREITPVSILDLSKISLPCHSRSHSRGDLILARLTAPLRRFAQAYEIDMRRREELLEADLFNPDPAASSKMQTGMHCRFGLPDDLLITPGLKFAGQLSAALILGAAGVRGDSVSLAWDPNSPADEVTDYIVLVGDRPDNYSYSFRVGTNTNAIVTGLRFPTRAYFRVLASASGSVSEPSNEVAYQTVPPSTLQAAMFVPAGNGAVVSTNRSSYIAATVRVALTKLPGAAPTITINGPASLKVRLETATDLKQTGTQWTALGDAIIGTNGVAQVFDPTSAEVATRFYRVR